MKHIAILHILNETIKTGKMMRGKGLSIYIEAGRKVLFDAGSKYYSLEYNASIIGVDLGELDFAVLSHWHRDHYGGFSALTKYNKDLTIYTPPGPTNKLERLGFEIMVVNETIKVNDLVIMAPLYDPENDIFEISLLIESRKGPLLVIGCGHPGTLNIVKKAITIVGRKPYMIVGGIGGVRMENLPELLTMVEGPLCVSHCMNKELRQVLDEEYINRSCRIMPGTTILIQ